MASSPKNLYRSMLRQVRLSDNIHTFTQSKASSAVIQNLRNQLVQALRAPTANGPPVDGQKLSPAEEKAQKARLQELHEVADYLKARRLHQELLLRYNAAADMTQEERARLSARRVGLNMPKQFTAEDAGKSL